MFSVATKQLYNSLCRSVRQLAVSVLELFRLVGAMVSCIRRCYCVVVFGVGVGVVVVGVVNVVAATF